jgi:hypothetical protein
VSTRSSAEARARHGGRVLLSVACEGHRLKFGFSFSNNQGIEDVQTIVCLATRAEEPSFDSVRASDRVFNVSYVFERSGSIGETSVSLDFGYCE